MKISLYQTVPPSDGSDTLPLGNYDVADVKWIHFRELHDGRCRGVATFVVTSGELAGTGRRIGCAEEFPGSALSLDAVLCSSCDDWSTGGPCATGVL